MSQFEGTADFVLATPDGELPGPDKLHKKNPEWVTRHKAELNPSRRLLGRMPLSEILPKTDRDAAPVAASFEALPQHTHHSIAQLLAMHQDPGSDFLLAAFPSQQARQAEDWT